MKNFDYERMFTSTGEKFLHHLGALKKFQEERLATPIVMHIMPTSKCNLNCSYCSIKDRKLHETLDLEKIIIPTVDKLKKRGLKAAIISGGGEPTLYDDFEDFVNYLNNNEIETGLITNGTRFDNFKKSLWEKFTWIRISINEEALDKMNIPKLENPTMGYSYVFTDYTTPDFLEKIKDSAKKNNAEYVRLLPDCAQPIEKLLEAHEKVGEIAKEYGSPFFHQIKIPKTPKECYLGYFHPVLYCDGNIYPCDSLVLNDFKNQQFKKDFKLCSAEEIDKLYDSPVKSLVDTLKMCPGCVFERQNTFLINVLNSIKHKNFI